MKDAYVLVLDRLLQKAPVTQISEAETFRCELCEMQFGTKRGLRVHLSKVHPEHLLLHKLALELSWVPLRKQEL